MFPEGFIIQDIFNERFVPEKLQEYVRKLGLKLLRIASSIRKFYSALLMCNASTFMIFSLKADFALHQVQTGEDVPQVLQLLRELKNLHRMFQDYCQDPVQEI